MLAKAFPSLSDGPAVRRASFRGASTRRGVALAGGQGHQLLVREANGTGGGEGSAGEAPAGRGGAQGTGSQSLARLFPAQPSQVPSGTAMKWSPCPGSGHSMPTTHSAELTEHRRLPPPLALEPEEPASQSCYPRSHARQAQNPAPCSSRECCHQPQAPAGQALAVTGREGSVMDEPAWLPGPSEPPGTGSTSTCQPVGSLQAPRSHKPAQTRAVGRSHQVCREAWELGQVGEGPAFEARNTWVPPSTPPPMPPCWARGQRTHRPR